MLRQLIEWHVTLLANKGTTSPGLKLQYFYIIFLIKYAIYAYRGKNIKIKAPRLSLTILLVTALNYIVYVDHAQFLWPAIEFYAAPGSKDQKPVEKKV